MTRKEEIIQAAKKYEKSTVFGDIVLSAKGVNSACGIGFLEGAVWADEHPPKESASKDLEKAAEEWDGRYRSAAFIAGANYVLEQVEGLLKDKNTGLVEMWDKLMTLVEQLKSNQ